MKFTSPPTATPRTSCQPGDDLDGLLSAFYQSEMPSPWPELELPAAVSALPNRLAFWQRIKRSHLALAASVALLIAGALVFVDKTTVSQTGGSEGEVGKNLPAFDPNKVKESIEITPEGAVIRFEMTEDENRY